MWKFYVRSYVYKSCWRKQPDSTYPPGGFNKYDNTYGDNGNSNYNDNDHNNNINNNKLKKKKIVFNCI